MSWDSRILGALPKALAAEFPVVLTRRSALSSPILALQWSLFQKGLGAKQFSNILTTLHMHHFDQIHLQYLHMIFEGQTQSPWKINHFDHFQSFLTLKDIQDIFHPQLGFIISMIHLLKHIFQEYPNILLCFLQESVQLIIPIK